MNSPLRIPLFFLALLCAAPLHAKDPADYRAGEIADRDLVAPSAFDAVSDATAAEKSAGARKIPAVFRDLSPATTNTAARDFSNIFAAARADFQAAVKKQFRTARLWDRTISSKTFSDFVFRYNASSRSLPVSAVSLAAEWARGNDGTEIQNQLLSQLLQIQRQPILPASPVENFSNGETVSLVPVDGRDEFISPDSISTRGRLVAATNLLTYARAQLLLRESFLPGEQPLAAAVADVLKPNCFPDAALTQQIHDTAVHNLTATNHFATGQVVVPRGAVIDEKALAVLAQMPRQKISSPQNNFAGGNYSSSLSSIFTRDFLLVTALVVVSLIAVVALVLVWRLSSARPVESQLPARLTSAASFSPQIAEVIKAALVQELAATRVELLKAQQSFSTKNISPNGHESKNSVTAGIEEQNNFVQNLVHEGQSRLSMNELEAALKCFDTAVTLQPRDAETLVKMGGVLEKLDRTEEAFACYDRAIAADGTLTIAYLQKGGLLNRLARYAEATQCYEKALTNQDKNSSKNSRA